MNSSRKNQEHKENKTIFVSKKNCCLKKMSLILCALFAGNLALAQNIITIDNNSGSTTTHQTIQAAHDAAKAGDIIYVQPSPISYGAVTIDKALTIVGRSHSAPIKTSQLDRVIIRSSNVTLKGLQFTSLSPSSSGAPKPIPFVGLTVWDCEISSVGLGEGQSAPIVTMDNITIRGSVIQTISVYADATNVLFSNNILGASFQTYNSSTLVVANNIFKFTSNMYLYNYSTTGTVILYNNMFISNYASDANVDFTGAFNLSNNLTYNYDAAFNVLFTNPNGSYTESNTLANINPQFTNVDSSSNSSLAGNSNYDPGFRLEDDLTLKPGSPALTAGGGGSEIGVNNNDFKYDTLGAPHGVPTLDVVSYDGAVPKNGSINVTIKAKAH